MDLKCDLTATKRLLWKGFGVGRTTFSSCDCRIRAILLSREQPKSLITFAQVSPSPKAASEVLLHSPAPSYHKIQIQTEIQTHNSQVFPRYDAFSWGRECYPNVAPFGWQNKLLLFALRFEKPISANHFITTKQRTP